MEHFVLIENLEREDISEKRMYNFNSLLSQKEPSTLHCFLSNVMDIQI